MYIFVHRNFPTFITLIDIQIKLARKNFCIACMCFCFSVGKNHVIVYCLAGLHCFPVSCCICSEQPAWLILPWAQGNTLNQSFYRSWKAKKFVNNAKELRSRVAESLMSLPFYLGYRLSELFIFVVDPHRNMSKCLKNISVIIQVYAELNYRLPKPSRLVSMHLKLT